jgi:molybdate transport system substrate-binding protein
MEHAMKTRLLVAAANAGLMLMLATGTVAHAAEIKVLSAIGMQSAMENLGPKFERMSSHTLAITYDSLGGVVKRVQGGEPADVLVIPQQGIDEVVKDGKAAAGNVTVIARSGLGVAVRKGAPRLDISSVDAFKRALLAAKSITYPDPKFGGASGVQSAKVLDRLGIADDVKSKTVFLPQAGPIGIVVANGEAELGLDQTQLLAPTAGVDVVGQVPSELQDVIAFSAAIMANARDPAASKAFVEFLRTPEAAMVIKAKGMQPATS